MTYIRAMHKPKVLDRFLLLLLFRKQHRHVLCLHYNSAWPMDLCIGPWLEQIARLSKEVCLYAGADWLTPVSQRE